MTHAREELGKADKRIQADPLLQGETREQLMADVAERMGKVDDAMGFSGLSPDDRQEMIAKLDTGWTSLKHKSLIDQIRTGA